MDMTLDPLFHLLLRLGFATLWGLAVVDKILSWPRFLSTLQAYRIVPSVYARGAAILVVVLEAGLAVSLAFSPTAPQAALGSAALLALYGALINRELRAHRYDHSCGCLGRAGEERLHAGLVVRNLVLAGLVLLVVLPVTSRPWSWVDTCTLCVGLPVLGLLYVAVDALLALPSAAGGEPTTGGSVRGRS